MDSNEAFVCFCCKIWINVLPYIGLYMHDNQSVKNLQYKIYIIDSREREKRGDVVFLSRSRRAEQRGEERMWWGELYGWMNMIQEKTTNSEIIVGEKKTQHIF